LSKFGNSCLIVREFLIEVGLVLTTLSLKAGEEVKIWLTDGDVAVEKEKARASSS